MRCFLEVAVTEKLVPPHFRKASVSHSSSVFKPCERFMANTSKCTQICPLDGNTWRIENVFVHRSNYLR